jgi:hypothetical protein
MEADAGSPLPRLFHSVPGGVFPMYHVLADLGEYRGGAVIPCASTAPLAVTALVLEQDGRRSVLVANLSTERGLVSIDPGLLDGRMVHCVRLNTGNVLAAMQSPHEFRQATHEVLVPIRGGLTLELEPCELLRLDGCG